MIKLKIVNEIQRGTCYFDASYIAPYDEKKWADNRIYKFRTLKEIVEFMDTCNIEFNARAKSSFTMFEWGSVNKHWYIDRRHNNQIVLYISAELEVLD